MKLAGWYRAGNRRVGDARWGSGPAGLHGSGPGRDYLRLGADPLSGNPGGPRNLIARTAVLLSALLVSGLILGGCIIPVPVPVKGPVPTPTPTVQEETRWQVTPTGTPIPVVVTTATTVTPTPAPTPLFEDPLTKGTPYAFTDNRGFHTLSVYIGNCQMGSGFYYTPGEPGTPVARWEASSGHKFLMVGVDFYMTGIRKEGKSSTFLTPLATSFQLVKGGDSYGVLNASEIPRMTDYYLRDVGSMYRDRLITKDDEGSGILIFEVPQSFDPASAYVTFCPRNPESTSAYYRSPDDWDCTGDLVVWKLR
jgi:hypothetical protein